MFKTNFFLKRSISYRLFLITFCCILLGLIFSAHIQLAKSSSEHPAFGMVELDGTPYPYPYPDSRNTTHARRQLLYNERQYRGETSIK